MVDEITVAEDRGNYWIYVFADQDHQRLDAFGVVISHPLLGDLGC